MTDPDLLQEAAARLVVDLMPIAVVVAGEGAHTLVQALEAAGAAAESLAAESLAQQTGGAYDLAILRADPGACDAAPVQAHIRALIALSDRIVFQPVPPGADVDVLTGWFEHFAELGFQPVVEYDAGYLGDGAFLVDRNATAAETDLAGFTERVSLGGALHASTMRVAELEAELTGAATLKADLAAQREAAEAAGAEAAALRVRLHEAEADRKALADEVAAWTPLRAWIRQAVSRHETALQPPARRTLLARLFNRRQAAAPAVAALRAAALVRRSRLFDAAWYIACHPDLAETGQDPAMHYVLTGAPQGFDPGPWFDTAAYVSDVQGLDPARTNPLVHAIETGRDAALLARAP